MKKIITVLKWVAIVIVVLLLARLPFYLRNENTKEQVVKIHATKLTMDDVMGVDLPPDPGRDADKTISGIDANENGIRDDVELAIFKEYPDSAKTRAVLLQYALALQMEVTQPFENTTNVAEVVREQGRGHDCLADTLVPRESPESGRSFSDVKKINELVSFVEDIQFNTREREEFNNNFYENLRSFSPIDGQVCDIVF